MRIRVINSLAPLFVAVAAIGSASTVGAQSLRLPGDSDTSRIRPPALPLPATPSFDLRIESPERSAIPKAVDEIDFEVKAIVVEGVTAYTPDDVNALFSELKGRRITLSALRKATEDLENQYRRDGYFLVRVLIPPQRVSDGTFRVQVIEGFVENAFTQGGTVAAQSRVQAIIQKVVGKKPIDLQSLERVLLLLNDLPGVSGSGVLRQGQGLGGSELVVTLNDLPPTGLSASFNNSASRVMGIYGLSLNANFNNPLKDSLGQASLGYSTALDNERLSALNGRYALPVGNEGMVLSVGALRAIAKPAGALRDLALESKSSSLTPRLRYPWQRSREQSVYLEAGLALNTSRTTLLNSEITKDKSTVLDIAASVMRDRVFGGQGQATLSVAHGLDFFGAHDANAESPSVNGFKKRFFKLGFLGNWNYRFRPTTTLALTLQAQETQHKLLSGEQIAFGGAMIGRGYDGGAISGDRGYGVLAELQYRVPESVLAIPGVSNLTAFAFMDYAKAFTLEKASADIPGDSSILGSHGLGLRFTHGKGLSGELMFAEARQRIDPIDPRNKTAFERAFGFLNDQTRVLFSLTQTY
ncbi:MAG: ShlB/FhaC/HecB family hemolysin secretion/activation protein [Burkholderiaceae bacterium]